jgi:hypothetical protein
VHCPTILNQKSEIINPQSQIINPPMHRKNKEFKGLDHYEKMADRKAAIRWIALYLLLLTIGISSIYLIIQHS